VAIEDLLDDEDYEGFSIYFDAVGDDGRFEQLHMLAASNLLAKGYGYAAEGDMCCTSLVAAGHRLAPNAHSLLRRRWQSSVESGVEPAYTASSSRRFQKGDHPAETLLASLFSMAAPEGVFAEIAIRMALRYASEAAPPRLED
jgi:hypothetical protein